METRKTVLLPNVGNVLLVKNKLSRGISIKVRHDCSVRVSLPWRTAFSEAETFLVKKQEWIVQAIEKMNQNKIQKQRIYQGNGEKVSLYHMLDVETHELNQILINVSKGRIRITYPSILQVNDSQVQESIKKGILFAMKHEAKNYLPLRLQELALKHQLSYKRITIRDAKTRWGSCSADNSINLSYHLMKLPVHLIDYVILHELAHTIHKNHGKNFWIFLDQLSGNLARQLAREMKQYTTHL